MRHVALVGFMAAGKSTVGRLVADELDLPFVDTDAMIVEEHGEIAEIFAREGQARFREFEYAVVARALAGPVAVIALGGGAVTHSATHGLLGESSALRVYMRVEPETILRRVRRSKDVRPVLGSTPTLERIRELLAAREPLYHEAEIHVHGDGRTPRRYASEIAEAIRSWEAALAVQESNLR
ncbi:MAG TPA: shikimate kinase [Candidatus Baltobacteraceae bacterium]|jgi:shikimate kinase|nr:shikimate kinase [Candidatus Baltobacteraceae bacterium]